MKTNHPSCRDDDALLHKHLIVPASIWAALVVAASAVTWVESAQAPSAAPAAALPAVAPAGSA